MGCCIPKPKDLELTSTDDDQEIAPGGLEDSTLQGPYYGACPHTRPPAANSNSGPIWYWWQGTKNRLAPSQSNRYQPCISQLALAMYNTELTATAIVGMPRQSFLNASVTEELVRKAKNEGSTVTMRDGHLYIDYKYVGRVPPEMKIVS